MENGPLMIVPGSHHGPVYDHHADGRFCGAMDPARGDVRFCARGAADRPRRARSRCTTCARCTARRQPSARDRRLLLFQFRAADAWPLLGFPAGIAAYDALMVAGASQLEPRLAPVPVRMPLPPAEHQGSIYENQKGAGRRYFAAAPEPVAAL